MSLSANIDAKTRREVYRRDDYQCALCGSTTQLQIHHYIHRILGGGNSPHNLITLCSICHAMAHGCDLANIGFTAADMEQAICEYLADYYMDTFDPWQ